MEERTLLTAVVVNSTSDTATGAGVVTLRTAINDANSSSTPTTITFSSTVFATPQTITLDGKQLVLSNAAEPTSISGPSAGVTISGNNASRVLQVDGSVTASISGVSITNGKVVGFNSYAGSGSAWGGGIINGGILTLTDVTVADNSASYVGGGIYNALNSPGFGQLTLNDVTLSNNTSASDGGGLFDDGSAVLTNVTATGNSALQGGGIYSSDHSQISLALYDVTISNNSATSDGGGIYSDGVAAQVTLGNTIVAANRVATGGAGPDVSNGITSLGHNLIGEADGSSGWVSSDLTGSVASPRNPDLGALAANGGPTQTLLPLSDSPAIAAGSISLIPSGVTTDQRGEARTIDGQVDIGAVEVGGTSHVPLHLHTGYTSAALATGKISPVTGDAPLTSTATVTSLQNLWLSTSITGTGSATASPAAGTFAADGLIAPDAKGSYSAQFLAVGDRVTVGLSVSAAAGVMNLLGLVLPASAWKPSDKLIDELDKIYKTTALFSAKADLIAGAAGRISAASAAHAIADYTAELFANGDAQWKLVKADLKDAGVALTTAEVATLESSKKIDKLAKALVGAAQLDTQLVSGAPIDVDFTAGAG